MGQTDPGKYFAVSVTKLLAVVWTHQQRPYVLYPVSLFAGFVDCAWLLLSFIFGQISHLLLFLLQCAYLLYLYSRVMQHMVFPKAIRGLALIAGVI